jgi:hypothetical protein
VVGLLAGLVGQTSETYESDAAGVKILNVKYESPDRYFYFAMSTRIVIDVEFDWTFAQW